MEAGINFFDTADLYSLGDSEEITGRALKDLRTRDDVVIATKVFNAMGRCPTSRAFRASTSWNHRCVVAAPADDYVDLYQIHRWDHETPIEETIEALTTRQRRQGALSRRSRCRPGSSPKCCTCARARPTQFVSMQNHYNLVYREEEREMIPLCRWKASADTVSPNARAFSPATRGRSGDHVAQQNRQVTQN